MVRFLDLSARGVYFYENFKPRKLSLRVASLDDDLADDPKESRALRIQRESLNEEMAGSEYRRSNPDVFSYAICEKPEKDVTIVEMIFFWRASPVGFLSSRRGTPDILTALTVIKMLCYVTARTFEGDKWPRSCDQGTSEAAICRSTGRHQDGNQSDAKPRFRTGAGSR